MRWSYLFFLLSCVFLVDELKALKPMQARQFVVDKILRGHSAGVQNLRFSPDGKWLASASLDKTIIIWDVATGILRHRLYGHQATIYEVTFNESGSLLASASEDGTVCLWDARYGRLLGRYENKALLLGNGLVLRSVSFVTFSKDSKYMYFGGDNGYIMQARIDIPNQLATSIFSINLERDLLSNTITGGTIAPNTNELIFSVDHFVYAISLKNYKLIKRFHHPKADINDVVKGATAKQITAWCYDGTIITWDYFTTKKIASLQVSPKENYSAASFNKNGNLLATGADGRVAKIWDWTTKKQLAQLDQHRNTVRVARFSPTEDIVATASLDGWVRIWKEKEEEQSIISEPLLTVEENNLQTTQKEENNIELGETSTQHQTTTQSEKTHVSNNVITSVQQNSTTLVVDKGACDTVFIEKEKFVYIRDTVVVRDTVVRKIVIRDTIKVSDKIETATTTELIIYPSDRINPSMQHKQDTQLVNQDTNVISKVQTQLSETNFESQFQVGKTLNLHNIQFKQGSATLLEESYEELEQLFAILKKHPTMKIRLDGHTDNVGVQTINLRLSGQRVRMVQDYLVRKGIERSRIQIRAYGGSYPIADNTTEEGKQKNRRVEVTVLEK